MSNREKILQTARRLTIETGIIPSMDVIAQAAGVSKGGTMHHFKSRASLVEGIALDVIDNLDQTLGAAATEGRAVETWLRLSGSREEAILYRAMSILLTDHSSITDTLMQKASAATRGWEELFAIETGSPVTASIVRLLGDGMLMSSITDDSTPDVEVILAWLAEKSGS